MKPFRIYIKSQKIRLMERSTLNLSVPQRQSKIGLIVLIGYSLGKNLKAFIPLLFVILLRESGREDKIGYYIIGFVIILLFIILNNYIRFRYFKFYINEDTEEFILESGWLNKNKTVIKLDKIQQVNLNQKLLHRLLNVYQTEIDTAGSAQTEVTIKAVSAEVAQALKERLLQKRTASYEVFVEEDIPEKNITDETYKKVAISLGSLIKIGLTRHYIQTFLLILLLLFQLIEKVDDYYTKDDQSLYSEVMDYTAANMTGFLIVIGVVISLVIVILVNLTRTILKYYNYKISLENDSLLISYGLLETKNIIVRPPRVQFVKISQNYFQKLLNVLELKILQSDSDKGDKKKGIGIDIPGVSPAEKEVVLQQIFNKMFEKRNGIAPHIRKCILHIIWFVLLPVMVAFVVIYQYYDPTYLWILPPVFVFLLFYQIITYKNAFLYADKEFIIFKRGFWDVEYSILEIHKIQQIRTYQYQWHRKNNIGSLAIYTAGGTLHFTVSDYKEINERVNYWLYEIESKNKPWM